MMLRWFASPLFLVSGAVLTLMSMLGGPSFWYVPCFGALALIGLCWIWKPRVAAGLSVGPLVSVAALLHYLSGFWLAVLLLTLLLASVFVIASLDLSRSSRMAIGVSLAFLLSSFAVDRLLTNRIAIKVYEMQVALDGKAPWGTVGPQWSDGSAPVVIYRHIGNDYCYVAFQSKELRDRLAVKSAKTVMVEYNVFKDFGRERGYNVRSVDGLLLAEGEHPVRDFERFGGQVLGAGTTSVSCW